MSAVPNNPVTLGVGCGRAEALEFRVPPGHVGPLLLSATGRTVWWTGRVAIGLRYQPSVASAQLRQSADWVQRLLLGANLATH